MGRVKMTTEELEAHHSRKSIEARTNGDRQICYAVLKRNDFAVGHVKSTLSNLGLWPTNNDPTKLVTKGVVLTSSAANAIAKDKKAQSSAADEPQLMLTNGILGSVAIADAVPTKYWTIGGISVQLLQKRLNKLNPVVNSMSNLRNMSQRGGNGEAQAMFASMYEFFTGTMDSSFKLCW